MDREIYFLRSMGFYFSCCSVDQQDGDAEVWREVWRAELVKSNKSGRKIWRVMVFIRGVNIRKKIPPNNPTPGGSLSPPRRRAQAIQRGPETHPHAVRDEPNPLEASRVVWLQTLPITAPKGCRDIAVGSRALLMSSAFVSESQQHSSFLS